MPTFKNASNQQRKTVKKEPEYAPLAIILKDEIANQITTYLEGGNDVNALFTVGGCYPASIDGFEQYNIYLVERTTRLDRTSGELMNATMSMVVIDKATGVPAFFANAYINRNGSAGCAVYEQSPKGTIYRNTLRWKYVAE